MATVTTYTDPWPYWTGSTGVGASTYTTGGTIWTYWNTTSSISTTISVANPWPYWQQQYALQQAHAAIQQAQLNSQRVQQRLQGQVYKAPTKEQLAAWAKQEKEAREREEQRVRDLKKARDRADLLLRESLTPEQREDLEKKHCFYLETIAKDGKRNRYRIDRGTHGNVKLLDEKGSIIGKYCVQPNGVPAEDAMLAQKLWLETDEDAFKRVANFTRY